MIKKSKEKTKEQPPQESYKLTMGSTPHSEHMELIGKTIPLKRSERRPMSLEEAGKESPNSSDFLFGIPGASIIKSKERRFDTNGGWYDV